MNTCNIYCTKYISIVDVGSIKNTENWPLRVIICYFFSVIYFCPERTFIWKDGWNTGCRCQMLQTGQEGRKERNLSCLLINKNTRLDVYCLLWYWQVCTNRKYEGRFLNNFEWLWSPRTIGKDESKLMIRQWSSLNKIHHFFHLCPF